MPSNDIHVPTDMQDLRRILNTLNMLNLQRYRSYQAEAIDHFNKILQG